jgi:hypothetical protein
MISKSARLLLAAGLAGLSLAPLPASAGWLSWGTGSHPLLQAGLNACGGDIAHFCTSVAPGGGRIAQCLMDHRDAFRRRAARSCSSLRTCDLHILPAVRMHRVCVPTFSQAAAASWRAFVRAPRISRPRAKRV